MVNVQFENMFNLTHKMVLFKIKDKIFCITNELFNKPKKLKKCMYELKNYLTYRKQTFYNL